VAVRFPSIRFAPRAFWIGVQVGEREPEAAGWYRTICVCPLPCVVISFDVLVKRDPS
jgi:hypothetical protein